MVCLARAGANAYIVRVASKENLADDPSRERYALLEQCGALSVAPKLDQRFSNAQAWESLMITALRPSMWGTAKTAAETVDSAVIVLD